MPSAGIHSDHHLCGLSTLASRARAHLRACKKDDQEGSTPMKFPHRRQILHLATGAAALPAISHFALAQAFPTRPVRIIVGYAAGGGTDISARVIGQWRS